MSAVLENPVWGVVPDRIEQAAESAESSFGRSLLKDIYSFFSRQLALWQPDVVIVIERKATAVVRALKESEDFHLAWSWAKIISSNAVDQLSPEILRDKRILVFDDMMKQGAHVAELLEKLERLGMWSPADDNLRVAIFGVHEESSRGKEYKGFKFPTAWFYRDVSNSDYSSLRGEIVKLLQRSGSLMLDTEHIEVRLQLHGPLNQLVKALARRATPVVFHSAAQRTNITVVYDDDLAHDLAMDYLPAGIAGKHIVKKCRIVQRDGAEFAIIPICFPSLPSSLTEWSNAGKLRDVVGECLFRNCASRFYGVGLGAALQVLGWVLRDLAAFGDGPFKLSLPNKRENTGTASGYSLDHLRVMYPSINTELLYAWISEIAADESKEGHRRPRALEEHAPPMFTSMDLRKKAFVLLQLILETLDQRRVDRWVAGEEVHRHPCGLRASEIFEIGRSRGWEKPLISTLFDILIDEATLVTHVERVVDAAGTECISRTFEPDGEIVTESIRRYTAQWGICFEQ